MKKLLLIIIATILGFWVGFSAYPEDSILDKIKNLLPDTKPGFYYDVVGKDLEAISSFSIANYKNVSAEIALGDEQTVMAVISYPIVKAKDLGINIPILDLIELNVGFAFGYEDITNDREFKYGPSVTLINFKF